MNHKLTAAREAEIWKMVLEWLQARPWHIGYLCFRLEELERNKRIKRGERMALKRKVLELLQGHTCLEKWLYDNYEVPPFSATGRKLNETRQAWVRWLIADAESRIPPTGSPEFIVAA